MKLGFVIIYVDDVIKTLQFYKDAFGLKIRLDERLRWRRSITQTILQINESPTNKRKPIPTVEKNARRSLSFA